MRSRDLRQVTSEEVLAVLEFTAETSAEKSNTVVVASAATEEVSQ